MPDSLFQSSVTPVAVPVPVLARRELWHRNCFLL